MKKVLKWLLAPDVLPFVVRLLLVLATALAAEPEAAVPVGAALETAGRFLANKL